MAITVNKIVIVTMAITVNKIVIVSMTLNVDIQFSVYEAFLE